MERKYLLISKSIWFSICISLCQCFSMSVFLSAWLSVWLSVCLCLSHVLYSLSSIFSSVRSLLSLTHSPFHRKEIESPAITSDAGSQYRCGRVGLFSPIFEFFSTVGPTDETMDQRTDGQTDGRTENASYASAYGVAWPQLRGIFYCASSVRVPHWNIFKKNVPLSIFLQRRILCLFWPVLGKTK